jgi:hypothetical protein
VNPLAPDRIERINLHLARLRAGLSRQQVADYLTEAYGNSPKFIFTAQQIEDHETGGSHMHVDPHVISVPYGIDPRRIDETSFAYEQIYQTKALLHRDLKRCCNRGRVCELCKAKRTLLRQIEVIETQLFEGIAGE